MNRKFAAAAGIAVVASLSLAACSGNAAAAPAGTAEPTGPVTLTLSGAALQMAPGGELDTLVKAFEVKHPNVTITIKQYDSAQYQTLVSADLAAGSAPDLIWLNQVTNATTWIQGGQLLDVSDVKHETDVKGVASYKSDGKQYALPYRFDSWVLYYNKDLFDKAGVAYPDGSWTWADYEKKAGDLQAGLTKAGSTAKAVYQHAGPGGAWPQLDQAIPAAQVPGDRLSAKYDFMKSYYERSLRMQKAGVALDYNTVVASKLHYIPVFGKQQAAMFAMGSWYPQLLKADIAAGKAQTFNWGIAPLPQYSSKTAGTKNTPVTVGDPTGIAINAAIDKSKVQVAKEFVEFEASKDAALALAARGVLPAYVTPDVAKLWAANAGVPTDALSEFAVTTSKTGPDNPQDPKWPAVSNILKATDDAILSGAQPVDQALKNAENRVKTEVGGK